MNMGPRFPDDPEFWDTEAAKVASIAMQRARQTGLRWLSTSNASWIVGGILIAALSLFVRQSATRPTITTPLAEALAPADAVATEILFAEQPPPLAALLLTEGGAQ